MAEKFQTLGDKIRQLREARGWSQALLSMKSGVSRSHISLIELRRTSHPRADVLLKLAHAFDIPVEELYEAAGYETGERERRREETPEEILERLKAAQPVSIPVYTDFRIHAGRVHEEPVEYTYWSKPRIAGRNIEAYIVRGRCLEPDIKDGDIVIVDRDLVGEPGDLVLCLIENEIVVGRLRVKNAQLFVENNEELVKADEAQNLAVIIESTRRHK